MNVILGIISILCEVYLAKSALIPTPIPEQPFYNEIAAKCPEVIHSDDFKSQRLLDVCKDWKLTISRAISSTKKDLLCQLYYDAFTSHCKKNKKIVINPPEHYKIGEICSKLLSEWIQPNSTLSKLITSERDCENLCSDTMGDVLPVCEISHYLWKTADGHHSEVAQSEMGQEKKIVDSATKNSMRSTAPSVHATSTSGVAASAVDGSDVKPPPAAVKPKAIQTNEATASLQTNSATPDKEIGLSPNHKAPPPAISPGGSSPNANVENHVDRDHEERPPVSHVPEPSQAANGQVSQDSNGQQAQGPNEETVKGLKEQTVGHPNVAITGDGDDQIGQDPNIQPAEDPNEQMPEDPMDQIEDDPSEQEDVPQQKTHLESSKPKKIDETEAVNDYTEIDSNSSFFSYFMFLCALFVVGYVCYHNKQKLLALILEGRKNKRQYRSRRPNSANYHKLDCNLEEAISSSCTKDTTNIIY